MKKLLTITTAALLISNPVFAHSEYKGWALAGKLQACGMKLSQAKYGHTGFAKAFARSKTCKDYFERRHKELHNENARGY